MIRNNPKLMLLRLLITSLFLSISSGPIQASPIEAEEHREVSLNSILKISPTLEGTAIQQLIQVALDNQVPLGIVLGSDPSMCTGRLPAEKKTIKLSLLIKHINESMHGYHAEFIDGVVNVIPLTIPTKASSLIDLQLSNFHSGPATISGLGTNLWVAMRAILAPSEGTAFGGFGSASASLVDGIGKQSGSVRSLLNAIVRKGKGGAWIWNNLRLDSDSAEKIKPFEVYGYSDDKVLLTTVKPCSRSNGE